MNTHAVNISTNKWTQQNIINDKYQTPTCSGTGVDPQGVVQNKKIQLRNAELGIASPSLE